MSFIVTEFELELMQIFFLTMAWQIPEEVGDW